MTYITTIKLYLTPLQDIVLTNFTGTIVESIFLKLLDKVEPGLADKLHSEKKPKPFSVTPFFYQDRPIIGLSPVIVRAGSQFWFRVSIIGDLFTKLVPVLADILGHELELFNIKAKVIVSNLEVNIVDASKLLEQMPSTTVFRVRFLTPTRFALKRPKRARRTRYCFFPDAWRVVKSALKHWKEFVDIHISTKIIEWTYYYVVTADFGPLRNMRSNVVTVRLPKGGIVRGFVGYAIYQAFGKRRLHEVYALLRYAELMNVGTGRSMGLGVVQVQELEPRSRKTCCYSTSQTSS